MLFKPRGTVCTNSDPEGRTRAIDLVQHPSKPRLYCVGRLDLDASGLVLLTNDGEFANRLTHPRYGVAKGYDVTVDGKLDAAAIAAIERKLLPKSRAGTAPGKAAGRPAAKVSRLGSGQGSVQGPRDAAPRQSSLKLLSTEPTKSTLHLELCEHRNLQLRELMLAVGHPVKKLRRTSFGPIKLKGLAVGEWRELTGKEISALRKAAK